MKKKISIPKIVFYSGLLIIGIICIVIISVIIRLSDLRSLLPYFARLTGYPNAQATYLILLQNNAELRPTGGFISAYGILTFKNGWFEKLEFHDSYDKINQIKDKAPFPLEFLLSGPTYQGHGFRDANFNPDFTKSASDLETFFSKAYPDVNLDGIIAVNFKVIEDILRIVGPISLNGRTFSYDTVFLELEESVSNIDLHNLTQLQNRKDILKNFVKKLIVKISLNFNLLPNLKNLLIQELREKHVLISHKDEDIQKVIARKGWDGSLQKINGDFLSIVEANLGGMKSDRYIRRAIRYVVDITDETFQDGSRKANGIVEIRLSHSGTENVPLSGWYQGWIRTLMPSGSTLQSITVTDGTGKKIIQRDAKSIRQPFKETFSALDSYGSRIVFSPGEERIIRVNYALPENTVWDDLYMLTLRKQPGTDADFYEVIVKAPQGRKLSSTDFQIREDRSFFQGFLKEDITLRLDIWGDIHGPRIISQEIESLNNIIVRFNEPIRQKADYMISVEDLNKTHPDIQDTLTVTSLAFPDERTLLIRTDTMSYQYKEHFQIVLYDIEDRYGNKISPNPRIITAVLR